MTPWVIAGIVFGALGTVGAVIYTFMDMGGRAINWCIKLVKMGTVHGYDPVTMDNLPKHWLAKSIWYSLFKRGRNRA